VLQSKGGRSKKAQQGKKKNHGLEHLGHGASCQGKFEEKESQFWGWYCEMDEKNRRDGENCVLSGSGNQEKEKERVIRSAWLQTVTSGRPENCVKKNPFGSEK